MSSKIMRILLCYILLMLTSLPPLSASVVSPIRNPELPIVFSPGYDIVLFRGILGIIQRFLHPFDGQKYGKIAKRLKAAFGLSSFHEPQHLDDKALEAVHSGQYIQSLRTDKALITRIAEVPFLSWLPNWLFQSRLLNPVRLGTAGTVLAAQLAMQKGWAINLSGGYHHAKSKEGEGFCFLADIPLAIEELRKGNPNLKVLIVDLDAHRGNGIESYFGWREIDESVMNRFDSQVQQRARTIVARNQNVLIFDMFSHPNYPHCPPQSLQVTDLQEIQRHIPSWQDYLGSKGENISFPYPLRNGIKDDEYLKILKSELPKAIEQSNPDIIFYNAGSDIYEKDRLGRMKVTRQGIVERDLFVFQQARRRAIPICMTLSGGYSRASFAIVSESITNIIKTLGLYTAPAMETSAANKAAVETSINTNICSERSLCFRER